MVKAEVGKLYGSGKEQLKRRMIMDENIVLFGVSTLGRTALEKLGKSSCINFFCDNDSNKWDKNWRVLR